MTDKTFKVAGITVHGDVTKVRFTDDMVRRIKQFTKGGATRCDFVELPSEMTKVEAINYLQAHQDFQSPEDQATLADALADRTVKTKATKPKKEVKVKVAKGKSEKTKPSLESIKARAKKAVVKEQAKILDSIGLPAVDEVVGESPEELPL